MKVMFKIWRQEHADAPGTLNAYETDGLTEDMSFLEALDHLNERLVLNNERVVAFEYDCWEGICGQCGVFINGRAHGPHDHLTTCQLHMRSFKDGDTIVVEPWRAASFPIIKDLVVDRSAFDRIIEQGAYIKDRYGPGGQCHPHSQRCFGQGDGCCGLHWVRSLRSGLQKCLGGPVYFGQNQPPQ